MPIEEDHILRSLLQTAKTIAVVGVSENPARDSGRIYQFLKRVGYTVYPVNPRYPTVFGDQCYPTVESVPSPIDIVDVFRRSEDIESVVDDVLAAKAKVMWLQLGVVNVEAARRAEASGIQVVMNRCIAMEYTRLMAK